MSLSHVRCLPQKRRLYRSLLLSYQKKDWRVGPRQSFFLVGHRLYNIICEDCTLRIYSRCHTKRRIGGASPANPAFGMTTTKVFKDVLFVACKSWLSLSCQHDTLTTRSFHCRVTINHRPLLLITLLGVKNDQWLPFLISCRSTDLQWEKGLRECSSYAQMSDFFACVYWVRSWPISWIFIIGLKVEDGTSYLMVIIDREAGEIIRLVASVCLFACLYLACQVQQIVQWNTSQLHS